MSSPAPGQYRRQSTLRGAGQSSRQSAVGRRQRQQATDADRPLSRRRRRRCCRRLSEPPAGRATEYLAAPPPPPPPPPSSGSAKKAAGDSLVRRRGNQYPMSIRGRQFDNAGGQSRPAADDKKTAERTEIGQMAAVSSFPFVSLGARRLASLGCVP